MISIEALIKRRPQLAPAFEQNFEQLASDLQSLDVELQRIVAADPGRAVLASHPVYQYLA
jgi:zinc transport system substrate-binding protein